MCNQYAINLHFNGVLVVAPKVPQWEVLFDLFEQQFYHPPAFINQYNLRCSEDKVIGKKNILLAVTSNEGDRAQINPNDIALSIFISYRNELFYLKRLLPFSFSFYPSELSLHDTTHYLSSGLRTISFVFPTYKIGDSSYTDVTVTTRANIAAEVRAGINLSFSIPVNKQLNIRSNIQAFNRHLKNIYDTPPIVNGYAIRMNMNIGYHFSKSIAAELFGNYNPGMKWQGKRPPAFSYTMAVRKQFKNNKGSVGFIAVNPFNKYINQKTLQDAKGFTTTIFQQLPYRSFGISFTYKFGKLKFIKPKESDNYLYTPPVENN